MIRKQGDRGIEVPFDRIGSIRYAPSRGVVGYVQFIERGAVDTGDFLQTIRDRRTVTFASRSASWKRLAEEIATRSGAPLVVGSAAPYWGAVLGNTGGGRRVLLGLVFHLAAALVALLIGLALHSAVAFIAAFAVGLAVSFTVRRRALR